MGVKNSCKVYRMTFHFYHIGYNIQVIHHFFANTYITFYTSRRVYFNQILKSGVKMAVSYVFENLENLCLSHMHKIMTLFISISAMLDTHARVSAIFL